MNIVIGDQNVKILKNKLNLTEYRYEGIKVYNNNKNCIYIDPGHAFGVEPDGKNKLTCDLCKSHKCDRPHLLQCSVLK